MWAAPAVALVFSSPMASVYFNGWISFFLLLHHFIQNQRKLDFLFSVLSFAVKSFFIGFALASQCFPAPGLKWNVTSKSPLQLIHAKKRKRRMQREGTKGTNRISQVVRDQISGWGNQSQHWKTFYSDYLPPHQCYDGSSPRITYFILHAHPCLALWLNAWQWLHAQLHGSSSMDSI